MPQKCKNINCFWTAIQKLFLFIYLLEVHSILTALKKVIRPEALKKIFFFSSGQYNSTPLWYGNLAKKELTPLQCVFCKHFFLKRVILLCTKQGLPLSPCWTLPASCSGSAEAADPGRIGTCRLAKPVFHQFIKQVPDLSLFQKSASAYSYSVSCQKVVYWITGNSWSKKCIKPICKILI